MDTASVFFAVLVLTVVPHVLVRIVRQVNTGPMHVVQYNCGYVQPVRVVDERLKKSVVPVFKDVCIGNKREKSKADDKISFPLHRRQIRL